MIGVFDSGFGGLTVMRALADALPQTDFVYFGDTKNAPYGTRAEIDVLTLTGAGVQKLFDLGCSLVVIVCNTASSVALDWIQHSWLPIQTRGDGYKRNVLGLVAPTIEATLYGHWQPATATFQPPQCVGVFATTRTVESNIYTTEIAKLSPTLPVIQQACTGLVAAIEEQQPEPVIAKLVQANVAELYSKNGSTWPDKIILGCTHYAAVAALFRAALPKHVQIINQQTATALSFADYLRRHPYYHTAEQGQKKFLQSGKQPAPSALVQQLYGAEIEFKNV